MTFNEYQEEAGRTAFLSPVLYMRDANGIFKAVPWVYAALGLGEAGEAQNKIKKILRDNDGVVTDSIREAVKGELGGILWYASQVAALLGIPYDDVATYNISTLRGRAERGTLQGSGDNR